MAGTSRMVRRHGPLLAVVLVFLGASFACVGETAPDPLTPVAAPSVDVALPPRGVADRGDDPAVVALDVEGNRACAGVLIAPDVVLTSGGCAPASPQAVRVFVGERTPTAVERARAQRVFRPPGGQPDVAALLLDASIDDVAPLPVRTTGAAAGGHARTVGYAGGARIVRDHVAVLATSARAFDVAETACEAVGGGPALDETSGAVVGVLASGAPSCVPRSGRDVYARADAALPMIAQALALGSRPPGSGTAKTHKGPVDMGAACARGADCAAGVCATYAGARYCSRACGAHDACPTHFKCMATLEGGMACVLR
jgi:hypothetical protein